MDYLKLAEDLVDRCLRNGADAAEVYLETGRNLNLSLRNGEVETVQESASRGVGFRVFTQGSMAFAHANDFGRPALDDAIERAVAFARRTTPDEHNVLPAELGETPVAGLYDPQIATFTMEEKIALLKRTEELAMKDGRITKSDGASWGEGEGETFLANSNGLLKHFQESGCGYGVSVVAEQGDQKTAGFESCNRRFRSDLKPPEEIAAEAARKAYEMLDPRPVHTQRAAVVFSPDVGGTLLGGLLGAIDGESVLQGASFLAGRVGERIASELLSVIDDGTRPKGLASRPFDGEGVPTQRRTIVDRGVLKGFLYNTGVAHRAGTVSTGNASRGGFSSLPGIGPHNVSVIAGTTPPEEIVRQTRRGLYLTGVTGYGINPVNGNFSGGAEGFWIENGRKVYPVKGLTIASTAAEMFNGIDLVGTDLDPERSVAAPTIRIRAMQIGGV
jgi:PmbA protein